MSTTKIEPVESESPTLTLAKWGCYCSRTIGWACESALSRLFEIEDAPEICFVAKSRADESTYRVKLDREVSRVTEPVNATLYNPFRDWLAEQIAAGRPHIGVRIIK